MAPSLSLYGWKASLPVAERIKALERAAADSEMGKNPYFAWLTISRKFQMLSRTKDVVTQLVAEADQKYADSIRGALKAQEKAAEKAAKAAQKATSKSKIVAASGKQTQGGKVETKVKTAGPKATKKSATASAPKQRAKKMDK